MLISMTGYGRAEKKIGEINVVVEVRALNSRFLEFIMRIPRGYEVIEDRTKTHLQSILSRGRVTVTMNFGSDQSAIGEPKLNEKLLIHYKNIAEKAALTLDRKTESLSMAELLRFPDVVTYVTDSEDLLKFNTAVMKLVDEAAIQIQAMRLREGDLLEQAISAQLKNIEDIMARIVAADNGRLEQMVDKLRKKISEMASESEYQADEKRIEQEIVVWSDKLDISEELTRLDAHVQHFNELMLENGDAGKRLNFLLQEMNREANTIGSKANSTPIGHAVVELKNEIERIREQVQNIQ
ncbi:YicC family protein [bacterium]|nr:YicC family protein [bacterium]